MNTELEHGHYKAQAEGIRAILLAILPGVESDFADFVMPMEASAITDPAPQPTAVRDSLRSAEHMLVSVPAKGEEFDAMWRQLEQRVRESDKWRTTHRMDHEAMSVVRGNSLRTLRNASLFAAVATTWCKVEHFARSEMMDVGNDAAMAVWGELGELLHERQDILVIVGDPNYSEAVRRHATKACIAAGIAGAWRLDIETKQLCRMVPVMREDPPGTFIPFPPGTLDGVVYDELWERYSHADEQHPHA